jgi:5-methylcytosine-specific restriction endonuclease McrA
VPAREAVGLPAALTRAAALIEGVARYKAKKPCPAGHTSDRFVSTGQCCSCIAEYGWNQRNPERYRYLRRQRRAINKTKEAAWNRQWRIRNKIKVQKRHAIYAKLHSLQRRLNEANRRARKTAAGGRCTANDIAKLLILQRQRCIYCTKKLAKYHIDHIMPIALGGTNDVDNVQLLCQGCNLRKSSKHPNSFAQELGLLL